MRKGTGYNTENQIRSTPEQKMNFEWLEEEERYREEPSRLKK
jgi:hypothetical protein